MTRGRCGVVDASSLAQVAGLKRPADRLTGPRIEIRVSLQLLGEGRAL